MELDWAEGVLFNEVCEEAFPSSGLSLPEKGISITEDGLSCIFSFSLTLAAAFLMLALLCPAIVTLRCIGDLLWRSRASEVVRARVGVDIRVRSGATERFESLDADLKVLVALGLSPLVLNPVAPSSNCSSCFLGTTVRSLKLLLALPSTLRI